MKSIFRTLIVSILCFLVADVLVAEELKDEYVQKRISVRKSTAAGCSPAAGFTWLDVNNVEARINTGGDMWWDLPGGDGAKYYIPKNGTATSMFSGALWIGGLDINDQLKLAALRYRQTGQDYWPGPLTVDGTAATDEVTCAEYDKHYKISREEVDLFLAWWQSDNRAEDYPGYEIPESIMEWPAHGDESKGQSFYLAPFYDNDGDGEYDPTQGDYPYYDIDNSLCPLNRKPDEDPTRTMEEELTEYPVTLFGSILSDQVIKGDQTLWWVFNDKGNIHTESQGSSIGMEIRAQAFAFATNDEVNNMTFYSYEIINRSTFELTETYFSPWVDTDLGYAYDDFVGCDVGRGLGYCYNGVAEDGNGEVEAYGAQPPAIGVDFFQGPYMDPDGVDNPAFTGDCSLVGSPNINDPMAINGVNFGNDIIDDERYGMRRFVYHINCGGSPWCDPNIAPEYYNMLKGLWTDNTKMVYGGNAHISNSGAVGPECDFMFPGDSDPCNWGTGGQPPNGGFNQNGNYWTEEIVGNAPGDRRFMQSAGPFTLRSGAVNYITVGIPWAKAAAGGPWESVELLRVVDDKCQALFDNCFKVIDGPTAPDLAFRELENKVICFLTNKETSNNYLESYREADPFITFHPDLPSEYRDSIYNFEGYQIYQLANATVSVESLTDPDQARLIKQMDVKNGVTKLINYNFDEAIGGNVPAVMVNGGDEGISHSFEIVEDAFATGDNKTLVNHKQYYYMAIAYAYNEYYPYSQDPVDPLGLFGQKLTYLAGRKNIKTYTVIPRAPGNGIVMHSEYGDGPQVTRIEGNGNGGQEIELTAETVEEILTKKPVGSIGSDGQVISFGHPEYPIAYEAKYEIGQGPLDIKVVDPLNVKSGEFTLKFTDVLTDSDDTLKIDTAAWRLIDNVTGKTWKSDVAIRTGTGYEQLITDIGLSLNIKQVLRPGDSLSVNNGLIGSYISYADSSKLWLTGVEDNDVPNSPQNWIRSGTYFSDQNTGAADWNAPAKLWDEFEAYEKILVGKWAPYAMTSYESQNEIGPAWDVFSKSANFLYRLHSIDIVFTPDKSKWTRAVVIEMGSDPQLNEPYPDGTQVEQFFPRAGFSVDKDGNSATPGSGASNNPDDPNYIAETGMGWFPGYAINVETGERLNIAFGEDSYLAAHNGRDMLFNPTARDLSLPAVLDPNVYNLTDGEVMFGGKHYVYVFGHRGKEIQGIPIFSPAYDAGKWFRNIIDTLTPANFKSRIYETMDWVGMPMAVKGQEWLSNEARVAIRLSKPYYRYMSQPVASEDYTSPNNFNPMYTFSTDGIAIEDFNASKMQTDLDGIRIVPNPYYSYSTYENNNLDTRIRIVNLPQSARITIYNVNGTMINQFTKDDPSAFIEWDLKNHAGVPIAGGVYLFHIDTSDGERILKWFGSMRPIDLNVF